MEKKDIKKKNLAFLMLLTVLNSKKKKRRQISINQASKAIPGFRLFILFHFYFSTILFYQL